MILMAAIEGWLAERVALPIFFALIVGLTFGTVIIPEVWQAEAAANYGLLAFARCVGERSPWCEIPRGVEIVLPVVAHPHRHLEIWPEFELILYETAHDLLPEHDMAVAGLLDQGERTTGLIVLNRRERVGAGGVGVVVQAAAADVGNVDAKTHGVPGPRPRQDFVERDVVLGLESIALRAPRRKRSEHHQLRPGIRAGGGRVLPRHQKPEQVVELAFDRAAMIEVNHIFAVLEVRGGLRQVETAGALVLDGAVCV